VQYLTCPQTVASKRSVPPHHRNPSTLRIRRGRYPRPPWCVIVARWSGSQSQELHRAAPTEAPSSRTERAHSIALHSAVQHAPTRVRRQVACRSYPLHAHPVHHVAFDATLRTLLSPTSPLETMRLRAAAARGAIIGAISDMHPDGGQQAQRVSSHEPVDPPST